MLRDEVALLAMPSAHHKALLTQAHALFKEHVIDADELSDLLELEDAALAYAVESLLDLDADEYWALCRCWSHLCAYAVSHLIPRRGAATRRFGAI